PREVDMPIIALNTNQDYFDDPAIGLLNNFEENWRRPVNVEYFLPSGGECPINQLGELRIHGGWSRNHAQKSLAVYSNKRFGTKKYSYPFWDDKPGVKKSKSFVLRNGGNAFTEARINDSFVQTLFGRNCDNLDWQAYRPVICYINGKYRGIYALRQRSNEDYVEDCYDGLEDIDMLENWEELKAGSTDSFEALKALYESNPTYAQMEQAIDVENFANLYVANAWATNTDFPGNNIVMWRPTADGGKWRWIMKDLDFLASNPADFNYFDFLLHTGNYSIGEANAHHAVKLFKVMTAIPEFREQLIDRFFVYLGDFLRPSVTASLIEEQRAELMPEYRAHLQCYGNPTSYEWWNSRVDYLKQWCAARTEAMPGIICDYFGLGEQVALSVESAGSTVSINDVAVKGERFEGKWPVGRAVTVRSDNAGNGWKVTVTSKSGRKNSYDVESAEYTITPSANVASIRLEAHQFSGVGNVIADAEAGVSVSVCGKIVVVESDEAIESVCVADAAGRNVASVFPSAGAAMVEIGGKGIY
ncbi:MAG: CotH kinase family protein, partial [Muribaculaceae bacterium]|nr:CotH kinase family protein [Muribaculaceae bacterium]